MSRYLPSQGSLVLAVSLALGCSSLWAQSAVSPLQAAIPRQISIPAQPLGEALNAWARQVGAQLAVPQALVAGKTAPAVSGNLTSREALDRLLLGSGLEASINGTEVVVRRASVADFPGAATLDQVTVTASRETPWALPEPYAGGQVARGGRVGLFGNRDVMDTPLNITSYTAQTIADQQSKTVADVLNNDPSVRVPSAAGGQGDSFFIRGLPLGNGNTGDIAFNGLYGVAPNFKVATESIERIEVIKGPSALLNGMTPNGSVGGSINVVPKRAADEPLTRVTAGLTSKSQLGGHLDLGRRFGDNNEFGVRFNGAYASGSTAIDRSSRDVGLGALALDYRGNRLRASFDLYDQYEHIEGVPRAPTVLTGVSVPSAPNARRNLSADYEFSTARDRGAMLRAEYDVNDALTAFAAIGRSSGTGRGPQSNSVIRNQAGDVNMTPAYILARQENTAGEAGLRGQFDTGTVQHEIVLSASGYHNESGVGFKFGMPEFSNIYAPVDRLDPGLGDVTHAPKSSTTDLTSVALADTLSFMDRRVQLTLGLRRQQVQSDSFNASSGARTAHYDKSAITPMLGLIVRPWSSLSFYGNYIEGLSKGDTAPTTAGITNAGEVFAPYKSKQHEIGVKFDHGSFMTTLSLFQITKPSGQLVGNTYRVDGEQRNRGVELNVFGEPARGVRLLGGVMLLDAKLTRTASIATLGNDAIASPRVQLNLSGEWDTPFAPGLTLTAGLIHTGKQYVDQANTQHVPSWTRFDLGARYKTVVAGRSTVFRLAIQNALNKNYWSGVSSYGSLAISAPRTALLSATMDF